MSNPQTGFLAYCAKLGQCLIAPSCLLCAGPSAGALLCAPCDADLPRLAIEHCDTCALPVTEGARCGACLSHPPAYDHVCAPFTYAFPVDALVQGLKYRSMLAIAPLFGSAIANSLDERPDAIIPMPLAGARLRERGFNQAQEIARHLANIGGIPLLSRACRKVRDTAPQAALPWKERAKNVRKAFVCDEDFTGKHVAVVDDVMTTGATLNELARNLKQAGALRVTGLIAARTLPGTFRKHAPDV
ncbi:MAG TPA: ComF family protein [Burkholderiales bacterium]|nr:ComF family protein [Burkholderiales bacterium]